MTTAHKPVAPREPEDSPDPVASLRPRRREISSAELFGDGREIQIRHADEIYTLRQTNKGKLILTK
jgi:hemin uptake protein HemP